MVLSMEDWRRISAGLIYVVVVGAVADAAHAGEGTVIEARGEAGYTVPIVVPPGPAGHQPNLVLAYNSGEGKGAAGWLGFGWTLSGESRIERDTRTGSPYDPDNEACGSDGHTMCYRDVFVLDGQDLICDGASCAPCPVGSPGPGCRYHTQSDDGRLIYYFGPGNGWAIKDRDGRTLVYGSSPATQLANQTNGQVFSWQLSSSTDVSGNVMSYQYDATSTANVVYLKKILYGALTSADRTIEFVLNDPSADPRPDQPINARAGFRQQTDRRVVSIEVRASGALVTRYELGYTQDPDSTRSRLATVQRFGDDGVTSLPPYQFQYSERAAGSGFSTTTQAYASSSTSCVIAGGPVATSGEAFGETSDVFGELVDVNRDGIADVYQSDSTVNGFTAVALGNGSVFSPRAGQSSCDGVTTGGSVWSNKELLLSGPGDVSSGGFMFSGLIDVDGDGFPDHLYKGENLPPATNYTRGLRLGTPYAPYGFTDSPLLSSLDSIGNSFSTANFQLGPEFATRTAWSGNDPNLGGPATVTWQSLVDITGDGRPDLVMTFLDAEYPSLINGTYLSPDSSWHNYRGWAVFANRGIKSGSNGAYIDFGTTPLHFSFPQSSSLIQDESIEWWASGALLQKLADVNGDGLLDRVWAGEVEYGTGAGFLPMAMLLHPGDGGSCPIDGCGVSFTLELGCTLHGLYDINGDGFLDMVEA